MKLPRGFGLAAFLVTCSGAGCLHQVVDLSRLPDAGIDGGVAGNSDGGIDAGLDAGPGVLSVTPAFLDFGYVEMDSRTRPVLLKNVGGAPLTVTTIAISSTQSGPIPGLSVDMSWDGGLAPGDSQQVEVTYYPTQGKLYEGELDVSSTAAADPVVVPIRGFGNGPLILCSTLGGGPINFGTVPPDAGGAELWVNCVNAGWTGGPPDAGLVLTSLVVDNPVFTAEVDPDSQSPASAAEPLLLGNVVIRVTYLPLSSASATGTLTINSNATDYSPDPPPTFDLIGEAGPCLLDISPSSIDFGTVDAGTTVDAGLTITNVGASECFLIFDTNDCYPEVGWPGTSVPPMVETLSAIDGGAYPDSLSYDLTFTPSYTPWKSPASYNCNVKIQTGVNQGPILIPISGVGLSQ